MKIYEQEQNIKASVGKNKTCSVLASPIKITENKHDLFVKSLSNNKLSQSISKTIAKIADQEHPDLMYGSAILVSTVWNENDDVFLPEDTWQAKNSIINQPFNDNHIEYEIIGHIIAENVLDADGNIVTEKQDYFDIVVDFVVYKSIFPKVTSEIAEKAPVGEKFVSMEARFKNFDYALLDNDGNVKIIARNDQTAFLTKYLKAYGGNGLYNNYKIGRVLREFRFVGMGSVDQPANPASKFTRIENYSSDTDFEQQLVSLNKTEGKKMDELQKALEKVSTLETELTATKADLEVKTAELVAASEKINVATTKAEVAEQKVVEFNTQIESLNTTLATVKTELDGYKTQLDEINKSTKANERFAKLAELKIELKDEQKAKIKDMSDEAFASVIEFTQEISKTSAIVMVAAQEGQSQEQLDNSEENKDENLDNAGDVTTPEQDMQLVAASLVENLRKNRKNSRNVKK